MSRSSLIALGYRELLEEIDHWFAQAVEAHPAVVPCRAGCSACCHGPFDISTADQLLLREGWRKLSEGAKHAVLIRARRQVSEMRAREPAWNPDSGIGGLGEERFDLLCEAMSLEPCPMLDEAGRCRVYDDRPMVCRMTGLGVATPAGRIIDNACPILDDFPAYRVLPPQFFDLETWEDAEMAYLDAAAAELSEQPATASYETTIAQAIVSFAAQESSSGNDDSIT